MTGDDKEEFPPLLRPGFHTFDISGLRQMCVDRFPQSITRAWLMHRLDTVISIIQQGGMRGAVWIDGSFLTEKLNPDDIDILLSIDVNEYNSMTLAQRQFFDWFRTNSLYDDYRLDNYGVVLDRNVPEAEYMYAYWLKQFGFSRGEHMKGVAVINIPFLVTP